MQPSLQVGTEGPGRLQGGRHGVALCASWSADLSGDQLKRAYHWRPYGRADAEQWQLPAIRRGTHQTDHKRRRQPIVPIRQTFILNLSPFRFTELLG